MAPLPRRAESLSPGDEASRRAAEMIDRLRYLDLATVDRRGPWVATVAYRLGGGRRLFCTSLRSSRHVLALRRRKSVAGSIYDSTVTQAEQVDGIQFDGTAVVVEDRKLATYLAGARAINPSFDADDKLRRIQASSESVVVDITVRHLYVPDQDAWRRDGSDARLEVDVDSVFSRLTSMRGG